MVVGCWDLSSAERESTITHVDARCADLFTYLSARPTITSVSPKSGPTTGGTTITIVGTGFTAGSTVLIGQGHGSGTGAVTATVETQTSTKLTAITPPGKQGTWNVYVHTPGAGTSAAVSADTFTYKAP